MRFDQLAAATGGTLHGPEAAARLFTGVSIDSRSLASGSLFVAIRGAHQDGHDFIAAALQRGAAGVMVEHRFPLDQLPHNIGIVAVADTHQAMIDLARHYRRGLKAQFVGITGSNGKTSTKEMTYHLAAAVVEHAYRSPGNLNNLYGVPLALLGIAQETLVAVLELGISTTTEMPVLADLVRPDVVVITNVGPTHLMNFGTVEAVADAKLELVRRVRHDATVIINGDDTLLMDRARRVGRRYTTFGLGAACDIKPARWQAHDDGSSAVEIANHVFHIPVAGVHQVYNLLAAYAACGALGIDFGAVDTSSIDLAGASMRGERVERVGISFIADCYNANPESVRAGLEAFAGIAAKGRRIIVLGDMLELGRDEVEYHRRVGEWLAAYSFDLAVLVGPLSRHSRDAAIASGVPAGRLRHFATAAEASRQLVSQLHAGDLVYLKGSRGIGLEIILGAFNQGKETA